MRPHRPLHPTHTHPVPTKLPRSLQPGRHSRRRVSSPRPQQQGRQAAAADGASDRRELRPRRGRARPLGNFGGGPAARPAAPGTRRPPLALAQRPSPWKRWVDFAVNINFPCSRQPRRRVSAPRPRSGLPRAVLSRVLGAQRAGSGAWGRLPDPQPVLGEPLPRPPPPEPPPVPAVRRFPLGPARPPSGKPKAQARQGLKETQPPLPHNGFEQVRGRRS